MTTPGVLHTLLESVLAGARSGGGAALSGMEVLSRPDVSVFLAVEANDTIHFLLAPAAEHADAFARFRLRALEITNARWAVAGRAAQEYVDLRCLAGAKSAMRRPFLAFCDDILLELRRTRCTPEEAVLRTCTRWQRFWTDEEDQGFTIEWLHGLAAELSFLRDLLSTHGPKALDTWRGPEGADHDFQTGTMLAAEVKASAVMPFRIHCNLNQLDPGIFNELLLVCYLVPPAADGETLPADVATIEDILREHPDALDRFWDRLARAGYRRQAEEQYRSSPYRRSAPSIYLVNDEFPKLTVRSFVRPPDARISGLRYVVEVTGVEPLDAERLRTVLASFAA
jgi:hypothetical protein